MSTDTPPDMTPAQHAEHVIGLIITDMHRGLILFGAPSIAEAGPLGSLCLLNGVRTDMGTPGYPGLCLAVQAIVDARMSGRVTGPRTSTPLEVDHHQCAPYDHDFAAVPEEGSTPDGHMACTDCGVAAFYCGNDDDYHHAGADVDPCFLIEEDSIPLPIPGSDTPGSPPPVPGTRLPGAGGVDQGAANFEVSTDTRMNPALREEITGLRGGMLAAMRASTPGTPARFTEAQHPDRPAIVITDTVTGAAVTVGLCDYRGARQVLAGFLAPDEATILRAAAQIMRDRRGGLATTIAVLDETAGMLDGPSAG